MGLKHVNLVVMILLITASIATTSAAGNGTAQSSPLFPRISAFLDSVKTPVGIVVNLIVLNFSANRNYSPTTFNFNFIK